MCPVSNLSVPLLLANSLRYKPLGGKINGCNMTLRRALVEKLGPFDEDFGPGSRVGTGDDTDYLYRAYLAGATLEYVPDMVVFHHHGRKTSAAGTTLMRRYMTGAGALCVKYFFKHPNLCRESYWDIKDAVRELITGTNTFLPDIGFSHKDKVTCIRVLTGSMCVTTDTEAAVFKLSNSNKFTFKVSGDGDLFIDNCTIKDLSGAYLVSAFDNYFKIKRDKVITVDQRTGKIRVTVLDANRYLPAWTLKIMWRALPDFVHNNRTTVFDLEVIRPGVVRLQGVFVADDAVLAITGEKIYVLRPELNGPVAFVGQGESTRNQAFWPDNSG
jgi:hypothetical protein